MSSNPFDRINLGYDGLFGPRTVFYHLQPASDGKSLVEAIRVPVLDLQGPKTKVIESGTVMMVILGFLWVCLHLLAVTPGSPRGRGVRRKRD